MPTVSCEFVSGIERNGYAVLPGIVEELALEELRGEADAVANFPNTRQRAGKAFAIRNVLDVLPRAASLARDTKLLSIVEAVIGPGAEIRQGIYFDKHPSANWKVAWHQDLTIAVRDRLNLEGYGPWSKKAGIDHVQPPALILESMLALRLHLDDVDESNGALRVLCGSHKLGRLSAEEIRSVRDTHKSVTCSAPAGSLMLMKPLLVHASSAAVVPKRRRVLHFEYSSQDLPGGLEWHNA